MTHDPGRRIALALLAATALCGRAQAQPAASDRASRYARRRRWMFTRVNITDIDRSLTFYREVVGLVVRRERRPSADFAELFLGYPDDPPLTTTVMLIYRKGEHVPTGSSQSMGLAFETTDAARACAQARALGGAVIHEPKDSGHEPGQGSIRIALVQDPDGHSLELVQYVP